MIERTLQTLPIPCFPIDYGRDKAFIRPKAATRNCKSAGLPRSRNTSRAADGIWLATAFMGSCRVRALLLPEHYRRRCRTSAAGCLKAIAETADARPVNSRAVPRAARHAAASTSPSPTSAAATPSQRSAPATTATLAAVANRARPRRTRTRTWNSLGRRDQ